MIRLRATAGSVAACVALLAIADNSWPIAVTEAPGQPISVRNIKPTAAQGLVILVLNTSDRAVRSLSFILAHADCPRSNHPLAYFVYYGDQSAFSRLEAQGGEAPLAPGAWAQISVSADIWRRILDYQRRAGCAEGARPELLLNEVAFCDDTGWHGVAGESPGPKWQGKPWTPVTPSRCT